MCLRSATAAKHLSRPLGGVFLRCQWESLATALTLRPPLEWDADVKPAMETRAWYLVSLSRFPSHCCCQVCAENVDALVAVHQQTEDPVLCGPPLGIYYRNYYRNYRCRAELGRSAQMLLLFLFAAFALQHSLNSYEGGVCQIRNSFVSQETESGFQWLPVWATAALTHEH